MKKPAGKPRESSSGSPKKVSESHGSKSVRNSTLKPPATLTKQPSQTSEISVVLGQSTKSVKRSIDGRGVTVREDEQSSVAISQQHDGVLIDDASMQRDNADLDDADDMKFVLCAERYLIGHDIRGLVQLDDCRWGVVAWNHSKVFTIDRSKPDAVLQFNMPQEERHCISMRLIPYYDQLQFPFAIVLCQTSICCIDFKRYNTFKICAWRYKGVPNNVNQLEMHLSKEDDAVGE
jgi:hypothetical protein